MQLKAVSNAHGAPYLSGAVIESYFAPSLRTAGAGSLRDWSEDDLVAFLRAGANSSGIAFGSMSDVIFHSTQYMSEGDARSTAHYLKSLESPQRGTQSFSYDETTHKALKKGNASAEGAMIYLDNCAACHRPDGHGYDRVFPALAGNPVVEAANPDSVISIILRGSTSPRTGQTPAQFTMPGFAWRLSDVEVLEVANFARSSWGNRATPAKLQDVAHLRVGLQ
jgi:mono/diheme cytochrome c family protein